MKIAYTFEDIQAVCGQILADHERGLTHIGLDTETTVNRRVHRDKVSTIQISYLIDDQPRDFIIQIYRQWKTKGPFPPLLKKILQSRQLIKVGVDITCDINRIRDSYGIICGGYIDVQSLAITLNVPCQSLDDLCKSYIPGYESKDPLGHQGDWDHELSADQIKYGTLDAYYSYLLLGYMLNFKPVIAPPENDIDDLCDWIKFQMKDAVRDRTIDSIVNQLINSYKPWANRYTKLEKQENGRQLIQEMGERQMLDISNGKIRVPKPDINTITLSEGVQQHIATMPYSAAYNYLANSYGPIANYPKDEKHEWILQQLQPKETPSLMNQFFSKQ